MAREVSQNKICLLLLQFFSTERVYLTYRKSIKFVFLAKEENDRISPGFQLPLLWERSVGKFCYIFQAQFCLGVSYQWRKRLHFLPSCGLRFSKVHGQVRFCGFLSIDCNQSDFIHQELYKKYLRAKRATLTKNETYDNIGLSINTSVLKWSQSIIALTIQINCF